MDDLERLQQMPLPFAALLGIRYLSASKERVTAELTVRDELCTRPAVLHGGAAAKLLKVASRVERYRKGSAAF